MQTAHLSHDTPGPLNQSAPASVRFGQILCGKDFTMAGSAKVWRRVRSNWAQPVRFIGGHESIYGGSTAAFALSDLVMPV